MYNAVTVPAETSYDATAVDLIQGYKTNEELLSCRTRLHKYNVMQTGGLSYYVCLVTGAIGILKYIESGQLNDNTPTRLWFNFENKNMGAKQRIKSKQHILSKRGVLELSWTSVNRRTCNISLGGKVKCKRMQFPVVLTCDLTIHKSQGSTFNRVVYDYNKPTDIFGLRRPGQ
jgi:hypothetical protein